LRQNKPRSEDKFQTEKIIYKFENPSALSILKIEKQAELTLMDKMSIPKSQKKTSISLTLYKYKKLMTQVVDFLLHFLDKHNIKHKFYFCGRGVRGCEESI
jgi:hypothetical protein